MLRIPTDEDLTLSTAIEYTVRGYDHTSFAELPGRLSRLGVLWEEGPYSLQGDAMPNITLWPKLNEEAFDALSDLFEADRIHAVPCDRMIYLMDGAIPRLPVVRKPPPGGYKKLHWLPVVLRPGPMPKAKSHK